jgi:hypothetical protein
MIFLPTLSDVGSSVSEVRQQANQLKLSIKADRLALTAAEMAAAAAMEKKAVLVSHCAEAVEN